MSKDSFARWLNRRSRESTHSDSSADLSSSANSTNDEEDYYVTRNDYERAQDRHDVHVKLPKGITILWDDDYGDEGTDRIPARDIRHGDWSDK